MQIYLHTDKATLNDAITKINEDLDSLLTWTRKYGLKLNRDITRQLSIVHLNTVSSVVLDSFPIFPTVTLLKI